MSDHEALTGNWNTNKQRGAENDDVKGKDVDDGNSRSKDGDMMVTLEARVMTKTGDASNWKEFKDVTSIYTISEIEYL